MRDAEDVKHVPYNSNEMYNRTVREAIESAKKFGLIQYMAIINGSMLPEEAKALANDDKEYVIEEKLKADMGIIEEEEER